MNESSPPRDALPASSAALDRVIARERVRAMESLAGVIAHEIRSAVLGVTSAAQLLRYAVAQDPVVEKSLGRVLQESERLSALHESLTEYATEVPPRLSPADPDRVWTDVITSMRGALEASSVLVNHRPANDRCSVLVDEEQMTRALERIVHHAVTRGLAGCELSVESLVESDEWTSTVTVTAPGAASRSGNGDYGRPSFLLALANRTIVAHGGQLADSGDDPVHSVSVRLPLAPTSR